MARKEARARVKRNGQPPMASIVMRNALSSFEDRSYTYIDKMVEELLNDPKVREKLEYHARQFFKIIAENL